MIISNSLALAGCGEREALRSPQLLIKEVLLVRDSLFCPPANQKQRQVAVRHPCDSIIELLHGRYLV
jgi:hypothetical protein